MTLSSYDEASLAISDRPAPRTVPGMIDRAIERLELARITYAAATSETDRANAAEALDMAVGAIEDACRYGRLPQPRAPRRRLSGLMGGRR